MNNNKKKKRGKWRVSPSWWLNGKQKINVRFQFCDSTLCISLDVHPLNNISSEFINGMQTGKIVRSEKLSCNNRRAAIVWNQKKAFLLNYVGLRWVRRHSFSIPFNCNKVDLIIFRRCVVLRFSVCLLKLFIGVLLLLSLPSSTSIQGKIKWSDTVYRSIAGAAVRQMCLRSRQMHTPSHTWFPRLCQ